MRLSTERQSAVDAGFAQIVGNDRKKILKAMQVVKNESELPHASPFGEVTTAQKAVGIIKKTLPLKKCKWSFCHLLFGFLQLV